MYLAIKHTHLTCVALSLCLFLLRGYWSLFAPAYLEQRWVKVVPHIIDTLLLASAITLTVLLQQYPFAAHWLTAKVLALLAYIGCGTFAIKRCKTRQGKVIALILSLLCFAYIVSVAVTHSATLWM
ncbi:MAG: regulator SirB [Neptuniibacter caesariensis]|uniref:Regulator SirB n=1 Tax=Neptuniibacter caesariensis TaxID=207954 RepID=A0A2G6JAM6_NEPCE|nr:MAG: regulator SirB [Neptuniibacter caesariensis]